MCCVLQPKQKCCTHSEIWAQTEKKFRAEQVMCKLVFPLLFLHLAQADISKATT